MIQFYCCFAKLPSEYLTSTFFIFFCIHRQWKKELLLLHKTQFLIKLDYWKIRNSRQSFQIRVEFVKNYVFGDRFSDKQNSAFLSFRVSEIWSQSFMMIARLVYDIYKIQMHKQTNKMKNDFKVWCNISSNIKFTHTH